jgi:predicted  nucleic acid-binding Zn-ribbon protein
MPVKSHYAEIDPFILKDIKSSLENMLDEIEQEGEQAEEERTGSLIWKWTREILAIYQRAARISDRVSIFHL